MKPLLFVDSKEFNFIGHVKGINGFSNEIIKAKYWQFHEIYKIYYI